MTAILSMLKRYAWLLLLAAAVIFTPLPISVGEAASRHIRIEASMFQFAPGEVRVNPGDTITIELVSMDVVHGLSLDGYGLELQADPGQTVTATFTADRGGAFRFRCLVPCGNLHPFMIGKLQVGPNLLFARASVLALLAMVAAIISLRKTAQSPMVMA